MQRSWPLIGRDEELAAVWAGLQRRDGHRGIVLGGRVGVGKTRLAQEALARAATNGRLTHWLVATGSTRGVPLGAFAPLVGDVRGEAFQLLRDAGAALVTEGSRPLVVGVDDAHQLDDLSAALLLQLVIADLAAVVVTVRTGEPTPDALSTLWKDGYLDRLEVQPLSESETNLLLKHALEGPLDALSGDALFRLTEGNPLYLRHLVDGEQREGRLACSGEAWSWQREEFVPGSELLVLVEDSLRQAPDVALAVLDLLAVGGDLDLTLVTALVDAGQVETAEAAGIVTVDKGPSGLRVRPGHPLYSEVRLAQIGTVKARRLRGTLADAMERRGPASLLQVAVLRLESDLPRDPDILTAAAREAMTLFDWPLAERLAAGAVAGGGGFEAWLTLGSAQGFGNQTGAAETALREAQTRLARNDLDLARVATMRAGHAFYMDADPEVAMAILLEAEDAFQDPNSRRLLAPIQAVFATSLGNPRRAIELAQTVLEVGDLPAQAEVLCLWGQIGGLGMRGRASHIIEYANRAWEVGSVSFDSAQPALAVAYVTVASLRLAGEVRGAETLARSRLAQIDSYFARPALMAKGLAAETALARGLVRTGLAGLEAAVKGLQDDTGGWLYVLSIGLTTARALAGDSAGAAIAAHRAEAVQHHGNLWVTPELLLSQAWVAASQGALTKAIELAHRAADWASEHDHIAHQMYALATALRFGDLTGSETLQDLAGQVEGPRAPAAAGHASALAAGDGNGLLVASRTYEDMGDLLSAADAAAQATLVFDRQGLRGSKLTAWATASRLREECENPTTPALMAAIRPLPLSPREREIVTMAAQGLSNRAIADQLVVSVRTVEGHLYRATAKLGIANRAELAGLLASAD